MRGSNIPSNRGYINIYPPLLLLGRYWVLLKCYWTSRNIHSASLVRSSNIVYVPVTPFLGNCY